jgi:hypothetical protein
MTTPLLSYRQRLLEYHIFVLLVASLLVPFLVLISFVLLVRKLFSSLEIISLAWLLW